MAIPRIVHVNRRAPYKEEFGPFQQHEIRVCSLQEELPKASRSTPSGTNCHGMPRNMYKVPFQSTNGLRACRLVCTGTGGLECLPEEMRSIA